MAERLITYETIYECLRNEKNREALQKLDSAFFEDVQNYLAEKEQIYKDSDAKDDVFSVKETEKIAQQLRNVKSILIDLYTRREKKIIELAINLVRTRSAVVDASHVHVRERALFDAIVGLLEEYRGSLLKDLLTPKKSDRPVVVPPVRKDPPTVSPAAEPPEEKKGMPGTQVEFLSPVDAFIDADLNEFGPFSSNERAFIPSEIASILIAEGKAREV